MAQWPISTRPPTLPWHRGQVSQPSTQPQELSSTHPWARELALMSCTDSLCEHTCECVSAYVCARVCVCICTHMHVYWCMHVCVMICTMCVYCKCVAVCMCVHVYMCVSVCMSVAECPVGAVCEHMWELCGSTSGSRVHVSNWKPSCAVWAPPPSAAA